MSLYEILMIIVISEIVLAGYIILAEVATEIVKKIKGRISPLY
mgnify:CR=1 FL=1